MKFEKKLIIMVGRADAKGTARLERNGYGTFVTVNTYNAPDLTIGEYFFGVKSDSGTITHSLGSLGKGAMRFKIEDINLDDCHAFVFDSKSFNVVMYGAAGSKKVWEGNLLDGIRRENFEEKPTNYEIAAKESNSSLPHYSARPQKIDGSSSLFWDIVPPIGGYSDDSIAEVNYYPSNLTFKKEAEQVAATVTPAAQNIKDVKTQNTTRILPSDMERQYLFRYRNNNNYQNNATAATILQTPQPQKENCTDHKESIYFNEKPLHKESQNNTERLLSKESQNDMERLQSKESQNNMERLLSKESQNSTERLLSKESQNSTERLLSKESQNNTERLLSKESQNAMEEPRHTESQNATEKLLQKEEEKVIPPPSAFTVQDAVKSARTKMRFYERAAKQIEELFRTNPRYIELERLMPATKWVRVEYNNSGKFYVVGLIGSTPDYLCYGVPAMYSPTPPMELDGYSAFLPLDPRMPQSSGFWLMYQDATTGESIKSPPINK